MADLADIVMERIDALAQISEDAGCLTRTFASLAMRRTNELVGGWMRGAGMQTRVDNIGNLIGHYPAAQPGAKKFLLGSHLDTVRDAGKYDGPLGVLLAIACVDKLHAAGQRLPFALDVLAFSDEEGVRYQSTYLGSRVVAGTFDRAALDLRDTQGVSMKEAIRKFGGDPDALDEDRYAAGDVLGYLEAHIEQGPVLEKHNLAVGLVTAIAGQSRLRLDFQGRSEHAGTTPMKLRRDALCAAAEFIGNAESYALRHEGLVATVGQIEARPGSSNVIPGGVTLSLDIRHQHDKSRTAAVEELRTLAAAIGRQRSVELNWQSLQNTAAVPCSPRLFELLRAACDPLHLKTLSLPSGAGHDAAALAALTDVAMLFVRCAGGISHNPAESVRVEDVAAALEVMKEFLRLLAESQAGRFSP